MSKYDTDYFRGVLEEHYPNAVVAEGEQRDVDSILDAVNGIFFLIHRKFGIFRDLLRDDFFPEEDLAEMKKEDYLVFFNVFAAFLREMKDESAVIYSEQLESSADVFADLFFKAMELSLWYEELLA